MPRKKTTTSKKTNDEKKEKTTSKKRTPKKPEKKLAKTITVDVISDDVIESETELSENVEKEEIISKENIEKIDSQKKYYSELVNEIKEKQKKISDDSEGKKVKSLKTYKRLAFRFFAFAFILLLIVSYFTATKLTVKITPANEVKSDSVSFQVKADLIDEETSLSSRIVPGEIIENKLELEKIFQSSGEEKIGEEVIGEVIIYNNYSRNQPLVATTRLLSADQKLFRLKEGVTVPAGSSVRAEVYADQVGPNMVIGPSRFTIPGLWAGLQDQIYAESSEAFKYVTRVNNFVRQADVDQARNDMYQSIRKKLESDIDWYIRPGDAIAYQFNENNSILTIDASIGDELEEFVARIENRVIIVRFSKQRAEEIMRAKLAFSLPEEKQLNAFNSENIEYKLESFDIESKIATINANFNASVSLKDDISFISASKLTNLKADQIKYYLDSYSEISDYELKFFPSFLKRAPHLSDRIKIEIVD